MAKSKQQPEEVTTPVEGGGAVAPGGAGDGRKPSIQNVETTFEERTQVSQPWRNEDGSENRGDVVESAPVVQDAPVVEGSETPSDEE